MRKAESFRVRAHPWAITDPQVLTSCWGLTMPPPNDGTKRLFTCSLALKPMVTLSGMLVRQGLPPMTARRLRNNNSLADSGNNYQRLSLFVQLATLVFCHNLSSVAFSHTLIHSRKNQILWARVTRNPHANWVWLEYVLAYNSQALWVNFSLGSNFICMKVCVFVAQSSFSLALRLSWDRSFLLQDRKNQMLWYQCQQ